MTARDRVGAVLAAVAAALPTLAGALRPGFVADDWTFAASARVSADDWWWHGPDARFRPIQALLHWVTFEAIGSHAAVALVAMALLEVVVVLVLGRLVLGVTGSSAFAGAVMVAWALLPNRSAPRLWISALPVTVAVLMVLVGALAAAVWRRPVVATALCCAAVLTYEAGVGVGLAVVMWAWFDAGLDRTAQLRRWLAPVTVYGAVVAWNVVTSPKSAGSPANPLGAIDAVMGAGLAPHQLGALGTVVGFGLVTVAAVTAWRHGDTRRWLGAGAAVIGVALVPLLVAGASPAVDGPVDRLASFAALGVAIVGGAGIVAAARWAGGSPMPRVLVSAAAVLVVATAVVAQADDVVAVNAARRDGEATLAAIAHLSPDLDSAPLVLDPGPSHRGWTAFGWDSLAPAVVWSGGRPLEVRDPPRQALDPRPGEVVVRLDGGRLVRAD